MGIENFKLLVRNLRLGKHAKLTIQTTSSTIKFRKVRKSISIRTNEKFNNGKGQ